MIYRKLGHLEHRREDISLILVGLEGSGLSPVFHEFVPLFAVPKYMMPQLMAARHSLPAGRA